MSAIKAVCMVCVTVALCLVLGEGFLLIRDLRLSVRLSDAPMANLNDSALQLSYMAKTMNGALGAETKRLDASTRELQKTEASTRLLIVRTNESLNGGPHVAGLLPAATNLLASANNLSEQSSTELRETFARLSPALDSFSKATNGFNDIVSGPELKSSLQHTDEAMANLADSTKHLAGITKDGQDVADKFRNDYLKPQKFAWQLLKELIGLGGSTAQMIK